MRRTSRLLALFVAGAAMLAGACRGDDDPAIDDSNGSTSSSALPAATACQAVQRDLERLRQTLGVPDGIEDLKQMLADGLDQMDTVVHHAGDLTGQTARPLQEALGQAAADVRSALTAVAEGNFGLAREELGQANDDVRRAWDGLAAACTTGS